MDDRNEVEKWAEFHTRKWGCRAHLARWEAPNSPARGEGLLFFNRRGHLYLPPLNPYHPFVFHPTPTDKPYKLTRQWHEVAKAMIPDLRKVQRSASFVFPPGIADIRPFVWSGFIAEVKYTYIVELPYEIDQASTEIRAKIKKATAAGYWTALTQDMAEVYQCLQGTETRQGFSHHLTQQDLELAQSLLGDQAFRAYVCYAPNGEPVSTSVVVSLDGRRAFGWIAASKTEHLNLGVVQQSQSFALQDLSDLGFAEFDFAGANLPTVAYSKTNWGGRVTPYYLIRSPGLKEIFRAGRDWMRFVRRSRQPL
ncbi:GNAT family N-acetyltransferase [Paenibacillus phoenicis]|uniref:GNAT family N-acetyltransferase n=1 Tax=Paenibacillus phoenicis TaxID=554117 RepID=A0ABU5PQK6_9BACL|nr:MULTISPECIES: GNAT family N-acetyltransferase [Paenibacillus]MCT2194965.1 GNAT family N-acetyltransferase [Paenibacillus sp. p3-SID1389]MEA3572225.1 GNAT family N-acetyltransferase [Paenibacillus phoenicis]